jgi:molecular chaperone GrpE (heat shock protein)
MMRGSYVMTLPHVTTTNTSKNDMPDTSSYNAATILTQTVASLLSRADLEDRYILLEQRFDRVYRELERVRHGEHIEERRRVCYPLIQSRDVIAEQLRHAAQPETIAILHMLDNELKQALEREGIDEITNIIPGMHFTTYERRLIAVIQTVPAPDIMLSGMIKSVARCGYLMRSPEAGDNVVIREAQVHVFGAPVSTKEELLNHG